MQTVASLGVSPFIFRRLMSHLATRFLPVEKGKEIIHAVDPVVDLRERFDDMDRLKEELSRRKMDIDAETLKKDYEQWWHKYSESLEAKEDKELSSRLRREAKLLAVKGLVSALSLPAPLLLPSAADDPSPAPSSSVAPHLEFLAKSGRARIDKRRKVVQLIDSPVLVQRRLASQCLESARSSGSILVSSPRLVRAAVVEAAYRREGALAYSENPDSAFLVGCTLPSLLAPFINSRLTLKTNTWPISVHSSGAKYEETRGEEGVVNLHHSSQRFAFCRLYICRDAKEADKTAETAVEWLDALLGSELKLKKMEKRRLAPANLHPSESDARSFTTRGLEVGRVAMLSDFVARRLNLTLDEGDWPHLVVVDIDVSRATALLFDSALEKAREPPRD